MILVLSDLDVILPNILVFDIRCAIWDKIAIFVKSYFVNRIFKIGKNYVIYVVL